MIVTNGRGLYRYQIMDVVEVIGFSQRAPLLRFVGKADSTTDLVGEKLHAAHVQSVLEGAFAVHRLAPTFFQRVARDGNPPRYRLRIADIEVNENQQLRFAIRETVESGLESNPGYRNARGANQLGPLQIEAITPQQANQLTANNIEQRLRAGARYGDIKLGVLMQDTA